MTSWNIAVLSDIHGNYISLQKCLDYAIERGGGYVSLSWGLSGRTGISPKDDEHFVFAKGKVSVLFHKGK